MYTSGEWEVADLATSMTKVKQALRDTCASSNDTHQPNSEGSKNRRSGQTARTVQDIQQREGASSRYGEAQRYPALGTSFLDHAMTCGNSQTSSLLGHNRPNIGKSTGHVTARASFHDQTAASRLMLELYQQQHGLARSSVGLRVPPMLAAVAPPVLAPGQLNPAHAGSALSLLNLLSEQQHLRLLLASHQQQQQQQPSSSSILLAQEGTGLSPEQRQLLLQQWAGAPPIRNNNSPLYSAVMAGAERVTPPVPDPSAVTVDAASPTASHQDVPENSSKE